MNSGQILVVDDEQDVAEVAVFLLTSRGYAARYAPNGEVALQAILHNRVALVLTDYMMPVMDGPELLQTLRTTKETAAIPVVMLSALPEEVVRAKVECIDAFIRKPFRAGHLVQTVQEILGPP